MLMRMLKSRVSPFLCCYTFISRTWASLIESRTLCKLAETLKVSCASPCNTLSRANWVEALGLWSRGIQRSTRRNCIVVSATAQPNSVSIYYMIMECHDIPPTKRPMLRIKDGGRPWLPKKRVTGGNSIRRALLTNGSPILMIPFHEFAASAAFPRLSRIPVAVKLACSRLSEWSWSKVVIFMTTSLSFPNRCNDQSYPLYAPVWIALPDLNCLVEHSWKKSQEPKDPTWH